MFDIHSNARSQYFLYLAYLNSLTFRQVIDKKATVSGSVISILQRKLTITSVNQLKIDLKAPIITPLKKNLQKISLHIKVQKSWLKKSSCYSLILISTHFDHATDICDNCSFIMRQITLAVSTERLVANYRRQSSL